LTSAEAVKTYRAIYNLLLLLRAVIVWVAMTIKERCDQYVDSCLADESTSVEVVADEDTPNQVTESVLVVAEIQVLQVVKDLENLSIEELRIKCKELGIKTRLPGSNGRRLRRDELITLLVDCEDLEQ